MTFDLKKVIRNRKWSAQRLQQDVLDTQSHTYVLYYMSEVC